SLFPYTTLFRSISFITVLISSAVVTTSLKTSGYGKFPCSFKASMIFSVCTRTSFSVSLPYKCWLPTTNQNSFSLILIIPTLPLIYYFNFVNNTHLFHFFSNNVYLIDSGSFGSLLDCFALYRKSFLPLVRVPLHYERR